MKRERFRLKNFIRWAETELPKIFPHATLTIGEPTSNSAAFVEIDTNVVMSRLTFWDNGSASAEAIRICDGAQVFAFDENIFAEEDFLAVFDSFRRRLADIGRG